MLSRRRGFVKITRPKIKYKGCSISEIREYLVNGLKRRDKFRCRCEFPCPIGRRKRLKLQNPFNAKC